MKRKLTSILLMSALLVGGTSTFVSCKDYDGDQAAECRANINGLTNDLNEQIAALQNLKDELANKADKDYVNGELANKADKDYVNGLIGEIDGIISTLQGQLNGKADAADVVQAQADIVAINGQITALNQKTDDLNGFISEVKTLFGENLENVLMKGTLADYAAGEYAGDFLAAMVTSLNNAIKAAGTENFTDVTSLFKYLDETIPAELKNLSDSCAMLAGRDSLLNSRIENLVTGVNVDMVSNPIYGTFNTPFGVKNYVLAGFVGDEIANKKFQGQVVSGLAHSTNGGNIYLTINPAEVDATGWNLGKLVGRDGKYAPGFGDLILAADNTPVTTTKASNGLGGYVAAPAIEDAKAAKINIKKDELAAVAKNVLGKLRGENTLDITNAVRTIYDQFKNAVDQYYAVSCQVKEKDAFGNVKTRTITSDYNIAPVTVKPLAYTTLAGKDFRDIPQIPSLEDKLHTYISKINYEGVSEDKIKSFEFVIVQPYSRLQEEYNTVKFDEEAKTVTIPLFDDTSDIPEQWVYNSVTGYWERIQNTTDAPYATVVLPYSSYKTEFINENIEWYTSWFWDYNEETGSWELSPIDHYKEAVKYTITVGYDETKSLVDEMNNQVKNIVGQVNGMFDQVFDLGSTADKYLANVNKVISKVNYLLSNVNNYLQPIAVAVCDGGKAVRLSEVPGIYTQLTAKGNEGQVVIAPTSYTGELLAPAYKKSVKVDGKTELNPSLDGATKTVVATLAVGTHTITCSSMDFYGNVVTKNYYVKVVK